MAGSCGVQQRLAVGSLSLATDWRCIDFVILLVG